MPAETEEPPEPENPADDNHGGEPPEEPEEEVEEQETYVYGAPEEIEEDIIRGNEIINEERNLKKERGWKGGLLGLGAGLLGSAVFPAAAPLLGAGAVSGAAGLGAGAGYGYWTERNTRKKIGQYSVLEDETTGELLEESYGLVEWDDEQFEWVETGDFNPGAVQLYKPVTSYGEQEFELTTIDESGITRYRGRHDIEEEYGGEKLSEDRETLEQAAELLG